MICEKCQKEIEEGAAFCQYCGNKIGNGSKNDSKLIYIVLVLVLFLSIFEIVHFNSSQNFGSQSSQEMVDPYFKYASNITMPSGKVISITSYDGDYYQYWQGIGINNKYLKYEDGKYYIKLKFNKGVSEFAPNFEVKNYSYCILSLYIDVDNQKLGVVGTDYFDSNNEMIRSVPESYVVEIAPNTFGYGIYKIIENIDENATDKEKEKYKGYFLE